MFWRLLLLLKVCDVVVTSRKYKQVLNTFCLYRCFSYITKQCVCVVLIWLTVCTCTVCVVFLSTCVVVYDMTTFQIRWQYHYCDIINSNMMTSAHCHMIIIYSRYIYMYIYKYHNAHEVLILYCVVLFRYICLTVLTCRYIFTIQYSRVE